MRSCEFLRVVSMLLWLPDQLSQSNQKCGPFHSPASSSLMRGCRNLVQLYFDCLDCSACVASDSWGELPVPPAEVIARGTESMFRFVKAVLQGGSFTSRSCRVMVVGPQMVRQRACMRPSALTAAAGGQDELDQRAEGRRVSAHCRQPSNRVRASQPAAVGRRRPAHVGLCR